MNNILSNNLTAFVTVEKKKDCERMYIVIGMNHIRSIETELQALFTFVDQLAVREQQY